MKFPDNNYAFIDAQNLYKGIQAQGWEMDWRRFRIYLREKYGVAVAYVFIGYSPKFRWLYEMYEQAGFTLVFKPTIPDGSGEMKGNIDADMVTYAMATKGLYDKAVVVTSDGDFHSLVRYLYANHMLEMVLSSHVDTCSALLKKAAKDRINYMSNLRGRLAKMKRHRSRTKP